MKNEISHQPVLLNEVLKGLNIKTNGFYVDGTFGRGGHSHAIVEQLGPQGRLLAMDKDPQAIAAARRKFEHDQRVSITQGSFAMLKKKIQELNLPSEADGVLLDLGVSSPQLDSADRGFSFRNDGELDMRMNPHEGNSAAQWLAYVSEHELITVLREFGEERYAKRIARAIVQARAQSPIKSTRQLAAIIAQAHPKWEKGKDPATRSFQAIRIFINKELDELRACLPQAMEILKTSGRLVVISFHSLEDRMVKQFMRDKAKGDNFPRGLPVTQSQMRPQLKLIGKAVKPGDEEIYLNPRSRSAVMRVAEKL